MITNKQLKQAIRDKFAWPGGYEMYGITSDGGVLCCGCMKDEYHQIAWSRKHRVSDGWQVVVVDHAGNTDSQTNCDHCNKEIVEGYQEED